MEKNIEKKEAVLELVRKNGRKLENFPEFQNDPEVVLAAGKSNGRALEFASDVLRAKEKIVYDAIKYDLSTIKYALLTPSKKDELIQKVSQEVHNAKSVSDVGIYGMKRKIDSDDTLESEKRTKY